MTSTKTLTFAIALMAGSAAQANPVWKALIKGGVDAATALGKMGAKETDKAATMFADSLASIGLKQGTEAYDNAFAALEKNADSRIQAILKSTELPKADLEYLVSALAKQTGKQLDVSSIFNGVDGFRNTLIAGLPVLTKAESLASLQKSLGADVFSNSGCEKLDASQAEAFAYVLKMARARQLVEEKGAKALNKTATDLAARMPKKAADLVTKIVANPKFKIGQLALVTDSLSDSRMLGEIDNSVTEANKAGNGIYDSFKSKVSKTVDADDDAALSRLEANKCYDLI